MNERIWEIWRTDVHRFARRQQLVDQDVIEKFGELIVRECAKFLDENSGYDDANNAWHPEPEDLLKHFGVN